MLVYQYTCFDNKLRKEDMCLVLVNNNGYIMIRIFKINSFGRSYQDLEKILQDLDKVL